MAGSQCLRKRKRAAGGILWAFGLACGGILLGAGIAPGGHNTPPPPLPAGHGQVLVRLVRAVGEKEAPANAQVGAEPVTLRHASAGQAERWVSLPSLRPEFFARELDGGPVWLASAPVPAGEFDRVRLGVSDAPIALHVLAGQATIVTLEVGLEPGRAGAPPRLRLKRASPVGP